MESFWLKQLRNQISGLLFIIGVCYLAAVSEAQEESVLGNQDLSQLEAKDGDGWQLAVEGAPNWSWEPGEAFLLQPEFKNEWWYFTGHLQDGSGKWLGYQVTFFRIGLRPVSPDELIRTALQSGTEPDSKPSRSRWRANGAWMVHFAVSDSATEQYFHDSRISREAPGALGWIPEPDPSSNHSEMTPLSLDVGGWTLHVQLPDDQETPVRWKMFLESDEVTLDLECDMTLASLQGGDGVSQKADGKGRASYYFSFPRMPTRGTVRFAEDREESAQGWTWFDREVGSNQLSKKQLGWDWFAIQLDTGDSLMLYQMRTKDGKVDRNSHGTWIPAEANRPLTRAQWKGREWIHQQAQELEIGDYQLKLDTAGYPVAWQIEVPGRDLKLELQAIFEAQEFGGGGTDIVRYWEGAHTVVGTWKGKAVSGRAYVELTGYLGALEGLQGR